MAADTGFRSALLKFNTMAGAQEARKMLHGRSNISNDAVLMVEIVGGKKYTIDTSVPAAPSAGTATSSAASSTASSRAATRFNGAFQSLDSIPNGSYGTSELTSPESNGHVSSIFSPQSPIGNHLSDRGRVSGKSLINNDTADDDEEKAKLIRAETERVDMANGEMAASLDYLRLPNALQVLKGGFDQEVLPDEEFATWCVDVSDHENPANIFEFLSSEKQSIIGILDKSTKQLDMEESVCEKMRSKYDNEWTQQPDSRLHH